MLFLEGVITFISPCFLPMLPIYVSYFAPSDGANGRAAVLPNVLGFVLGFTIVFIALGAFAGTIGALLLEHSTAVSIVAGSIVVLFGLNYLGVIRLRISGPQMGFSVPNNMKFPAAVLFGMIFSVTWTPCVGAFLGAALMRASMRGSAIEGMFMLFVFSMGLGLPIVASALLIERLKGAFTVIKRHYKIINIAAGALLITMGTLMITGVFGRFMALFS